MTKEQIVKELESLTRFSMYGHVLKQDRFGEYADWDEIYSIIQQVKQDLENQQ